MTIGNTVMVPVADCIEHVYGIAVSVVVEPFDYEDELAEAAGIVTRIPSRQRGIRLSARARASSRGTNDERPIDARQQEFVEPGCGDMRKRSSR